MHYILNTSNPFLPLTQICILLFFFRKDVFLNYSSYLRSLKSSLNHKMNDQEAIVLLKSDSHEAFEYLYKVYGGQVYNFSKLYINSSEDIKEVVQEVFVKLWEARSFLREDENFRGFLFIVTRNLIFNRQKKTFNENFYKLVCFKCLRAVEH